MVTQTEPEAMYQMRQSGATLEQVGSCFGITREGARQLLTRHYGSTRVHELLTTNELRRLAGCTWKDIKKLKRQGVIRPAKVVGQGRALWKPETVAAVIIYIDRHRCTVCHLPVPSNRRVYCSQQCYLEAHRYKNQPKEAKRRHNESVKRWIAEHLERARQIQQRGQAKQQAKISLQRYQTTQCVIRRKCLIPLGTVVRVQSYKAARGRLKVEWGEQIVELPFSCVKRMEKEAVAIEY